jgi:hypothetical protein
MYAPAHALSPGLFSFRGRLDTKEEARAAVEEACGHFIRRLIPQPIGRSCAELIAPSGLRHYDAERWP